MEQHAIGSELILKSSQKSPINHLTLLSEMKEEVKEAKDEVKQMRESVEKKFDEIQQQLKGASSVNPRKLMKLHCYLSSLHLFSFCLLGCTCFIKLFGAREGVAKYQEGCVPRNLARVCWAQAVCSFLFWAYILRPL